MEGEETKPSEMKWKYKEVESTNMPLSKIRREKGIREFVAYMIKNSMKERVKT